MICPLNRNPVQPCPLHVCTGEFNACQPCVNDWREHVATIKRTHGYATAEAQGCASRVLAAKLRIAGAAVAPTRYRCTYNPNLYAIVHPSTIELGRWQVSYFDERGAVGDTRRDTFDEAVGAVEHGFVKDEAAALDSRTPAE